MSKINKIPKIPKEHWEAVYIRVSEVSESLEIHGQIFSLPVCQEICLRVSSLISNYVFLLSVLRLSFKYRVFHQGNMPFFERTCRNAIEETACDPPLLIHLPLDQKQLFITICVLFPQLNQPNATL